MEAEPDKMVAITFKAEIMVEVIIVTMVAWYQTTAVWPVQLLMSGCYESDLIIYKPGDAATECRRPQDNVPTAQKIK